MPAVTHTPHIIENAQMSIDGSTYGGAIDSVKHAITFATHEFVGINGESQPVVGKKRHKAELTLGQDFDDTSLMAVLIDRHGQTANVVFSPIGEGTGQPTITGTVVLAAVSEIGGKAGELGGTGTTLAFKGEPAIVWAT